MRATDHRPLSAALLCLAVTACGSPPQGDAPPTPWRAEALGPPAGADDPTLDESALAAREQLGRLLFYDPLLSADRDTACATCHSEIWGMSDGLARSIGTGGGALTGPGRRGGAEVPRNAQTLWNVAFREALFWDGREQDLAAQALLPIENPAEMGRELGSLLRDLAAIDAYAEAFEAAFPDADATPTEAQLGQALADFQRTFISNRAPYDRYIGGDLGAMDDASVRGMWVFAELGCDSCHVPPRFESSVFADRGLADGDVGRFEVTGDDVDRAAFLTPTLRNLRETGPYFHAGQVDSLADAVAREVDEQVAMGFAAPTAEALSDLQTFLHKALMDRSREPHRPDAVPSGLQVPTDGFRIPR